MFVSVLYPQLVRSGLCCLCVCAVLFPPFGKLASIFFVIGVWNFYGCEETFDIFEKYNAMVLYTTLIFSIRISCLICLLASNCPIISYEMAFSLKNSLRRVFALRRHCLRSFFASESLFSIEFMSRLWGGSSASNNDIVVFMRILLSYPYLTWTF